MTDRELQDALQTLLDEIACMDDEDREQMEVPEELDAIRRVRSFAAADVLTSNAGLVVETETGQYQLTIIRSR